jgi:hypothetical protein
MVGTGIEGGTAKVKALATTISGILDCLPIEEVIGAFGKILPEG